MEVRYNITFDGDCVRGNIPVGDFSASCYASATAALSDVDCRSAVTVGVSFVVGWLLIVLRMFFNVPACK